jgi:hypothetical protein
MPVSISFRGLYQARRRMAEPRFVAFAQPVETQEHTVFEANQPVSGPSARFMQRPVQPGSMPHGHGTRSFVERDLAHPTEMGMASHSSLHAKGGPIISR